MKRTLTFAALIFAACCTQKASLATISFDLSQEAAEALLAGPTELRTCFNGTCWDTLFDPNTNGAAFDAPSFNDATRTLTIKQGANPGEKTDVSLTGSRDGGVLFTHEWSDARFTLSTPNGPLCGGGAYFPEDGSLKF